MQFIATQNVATLECAPGVLMEFFDTIALKNFAQSNFMVPYQVGYEDNGGGFANGATKRTSTRVVPF